MQFIPPRWVWSWGQRLGCGGRPPVQEVSSKWPDSDADASIQSLPPVARKAVCRRADARAVPHVHPVQSHERGLPLSPGHVGFPRGDRDSPTQTGLQDSKQNRGVSKASNINPTWRLWGAGIIKALQQRHVYMDPAFHRTAVDKWMYKNEHQCEASQHGTSLFEELQQNNTKGKKILIGNA